MTDQNYSFTFCEYLEDGHQFTLVINVIADSQEQANRLAEIERDRFMSSKRVAK